MKKGENHTDVFGYVSRHDEVIHRASDIASALGYSNVRDFVRRSVLDEDKLTCYRNLTGEPPYYTYVTINGARSMIASCKKPVALEIKRWLETEKLPSIFDKRIGIKVVDKGRFWCKII